MTDIYLEYGDVIHITSKTESLNGKQFLIKYIDEKHIRIANQEGTREIQLEEDGSFSDLAIIAIKKIYSNPLKGFALQNGLVIGKTIFIKFVQEDFPDMTGYISNLENDRIEIMLETEEIIYIDFEYKGLPSFIKQYKIQSNTILDATHQPIEPTLPEVGNIDILPEINEIIQHDPDHTDILQEIRDEYNRAQQDNISVERDIIPAGVITLGEKLKLVVRTEKEEKFLSHSIEAQVTDIVDSLLSTIPNSERTDSVLADVHHQVERYKQLITIFSKKDEHGTILCPSTYGENNKPLATLLTSGNSKIPKWILPVITAERKIYSDKDKEDFDNNIAGFIRGEKAAQIDYYSNTNTKTPFVNYIKSVNEYSIPYTREKVENPKLINDDQETLLNNVERVKINPKGKYICERPDDNFMIQKVTTGSKYTENETINIKSFVMLRDFMAEYSKINLNNSSIMTRSAMNKNHISFPNDPSINDKMVDKYEENNFFDDTNKQKCPKDRTDIKHMEEKELKEYRQKSYEEKIINVTKEGHETEPKLVEHLKYLKKRSEVDFLRKYTNYKFNTDNVRMGADGLDTDKYYAKLREIYAKFVYTIIPATADLIKLSFIDSNKRMTRNYSFLEFVNQFLEPFMVNSKNIHFNGGYHFIKFFIQDKIREYVDKVQKHNKSVEDQTNKIKDISVISNKDVFKEIIDSKKDVFQKNYFGELEVITTASSTERLSSMFNIDGTDIMSNIIFSKNLNLVVDPSFVEGVIGDNSDCAQKFIAKDYSEFNKLKQDNGVKELKYDAGLDDTPYELLQNYIKYKDTVGNFKEFLEKKLIDKHSCPESAAANLAATIIRGHKLVSPGEYARLNHLEKLEFFKRTDTNQWKLDRNVSNINFVNNNELFCNVNSKCIKNDKTKTCDSITEYRNVYVAEFKTRLDALDDKLRIQNENSIEKLSGFITRNNILKYIQSHRQNLLTVELAKPLVIDNTPKTQHTLRRDDILSHKNFPEKQTFLKRFADERTRAHFPNVEGESEHWLYCKETNIKLIPVFLIELATEYDTKGAEAYKTKLEDILSNCGDPDSDGAYYDKNSGYFISKMNYATTDDYTTHSIIEEEEDTTPEIFNRNTKTIETVFIAICSNLDILHKADTFRKFVSVETIKMIDGLRTEEQHRKRYDKNRLKDSKLVYLPYDTFINRQIIITVSALILISIQTATPSIGKTKTFGECVKSFTGYPQVTPSNDKSGVKYLSCAIIKLKSSIAPWDGIKMKEDIFYKEVSRILDDLFKIDYVMKLYDKKEKENQRLRQSVKITDVTTNNISKWVGVLPPIVKFTIDAKNIKPIDNGIIDYLLKNPEDNNNKIGVIKSKIIFYGYAIIESINEEIAKIIKSEPSANLLLGTSGDKPYTQNSCCNEINNQKNVLAYLSKRENRISEFITNSRKCEAVLLELRQLSTPRTFCYNEDTSNRIKTDQFPKQHLSNIIETFIHHLKFDENCPIPPMFGETYKKPNGYDSKKSFEEKIEIFRKANYDTTTFDNILKTVYSKKMKSAVAITNDKNTYDESVKFNRFITSMTQNVVPEDIVEGTAVDIMHKFSTTSIDEFKNYILNVNGEMLKKIVDNENHENASKFENNLKAITEMSSWNIYKQDVDKIQPNTLFFNFVQNAIFNVSKLYPSFIINSISVRSKDDKRWGLSTKHHEHLDKFNKINLFELLGIHNDQSKDVFLKDLPELDSIIQLSRNIPNSDKYDKNVTNLLLTYSWLSVFRIFIHSASQLNDDDRDRDHYNRKIIEILTAFLNIETKNKEFLDISNKQVEEESFKSRQREKKVFTDLLKGMNSDGRKLMKEMKNIGLGIWREGRIGVVKYDKKAYDRNVELYPVDEDAENEIVNQIENDDPVIDEEEQSGYDNGEGDGNDDNDNEI
jgi:hypothetical protein